MDPLVLDYFRQRNQPPQIDAGLALEQPDVSVAPATQAALAPAPAPAQQTTRVNPDELSAVVQKLREAAPPPDLSGLDAARAADLDRERQMALGRAGARAAALMTGRAPDYTGLVQDDQNVRSFLAKQQERDRAAKLGNEEIRNAAYLAHWLGNRQQQVKPPVPADDPAHPVSQAARERFRATREGADLAVKMGAQFDTLSAADIAQVDKVKQDREARPADAEASEADRGELQKRGINPGLAATHGDALSLIQHHDSARAAREARTGGGASGTDVKDLADGIESGLLPPDMRALYKYGAPIKAELARRGYDLSRASTDWAAAQRSINTLNGPQQTRLRQAVQASYDQLDVVEGLYDEWKQKGSVSGVKMFNRASLGAAKNMPGEAGAAAQALEGQIALLTGELGNTLMGGNSPTDHALELAKSMLAADWNEETFKKALKQLRVDLRIRQNSLAHTTPAGISENSPYVTKPAAPAPTHGGPAPAGGAATAAPVQVKSKAERDALAPRTRYTRPGDPVVYTKG